MTLLKTAIVISLGMLSTSDIALAQVAAHRCRTGYVWREATPGDFVCVSVHQRYDAGLQNQAGRYNRQPGGGAYGRDTCRQGYVWRETYPGDHVCVTPSEREAARRENAASGWHTNPW